MASSTRSISSGISPAAMVEAVVAHAATTGELAASTLAEFADVMSRFAMFMERGHGIADVAAIGEAEVRAFIGSRRSDGERPTLSLMHNRRTVCRYLLRTARGLGLCTTDPTAGLELPPRRPIGPRGLTDDEVRVCRSRALFHAADLRHPVAWALAEATARTSEIAGVMVGDVDADSGIVRLPGTSRCRPRAVAFTEWGLAQVRRRLLHNPSSPEDLLLPMHSGKVPRATASMAVIEVLRAAGISGPEVRPVSVVAWRGAIEFARGMPITEVAALLGIPSLDRTAALIGLAVGGGSA